MAVLSFRQLNPRVDSFEFTRGFSLLEQELFDICYLHWYNIGEHYHTGRTRSLDDAFGNITDKTGNVNNTILYAGYQYDPETGMYYLNARMYDPVVTRFLQEDTYRGNYNDPLSLNLYTYCHNEPLMYTDPTGHSWKSFWNNWKKGTLNYKTS